MCDTVLVAATIPKLAILALQTCTIAQHTEHLHFLHGPQAHLGLALALHVELLKNTKSRWWGYLQSLPEVPPTIPVFWGHEQEVYGDPSREVEEDAAQASRWAGETQIWGAMHSDGDDILSYVCSSPSVRSSDAVSHQHVVGGHPPMVLYRGFQSPVLVSPHQDGTLLEGDHFIRILSCICPRVFESFPRRCVPWPFDGTPSGCVSMCHTSVSCKSFF
jgi:hypothetical protein